MIKYFNGKYVHFDVNSVGERYAIDLSTGAKVIYSFGVDMVISCLDTLTDGDVQRLFTDINKRPVFKKIEREKELLFKKDLENYLIRYGSPV